MGISIWVKTNISGTVTKDIGKMENVMDLEFSIMQMEPSMKVSGKKI